MNWKGKNELTKCFSGSYSQASVGIIALIATLLISSLGIPTLTTIASKPARVQENSLTNENSPILIERGVNFQRWNLGDGKYAWETAPQWIYDGTEWLPYIYENCYATNRYYQVQNGLIGVRIYDYHTEFYTPDMSEIRVYEEWWEVQRYTNKWSDVGAQSGIPTYDIVESGNNITVTKTFVSWAGILEINYIFREGSLMKHEVVWTSILTEITTFRVLQRWAGIVGNKVKHSEGTNVVTSAVVIDSPVFEFRDANGNMTVLELQYSMYYDENGSKLTGHNLKPVEIDIHSQGMKADFIFGDWTLAQSESLVVDPDTATLDTPTESGFIQFADSNYYKTTEEEINIGFLGANIRGYVEWDVSSISDDATITNTVFKYEGVYGSDCHIHEMLGARPSTSDNQAIYDEAGEGTVYADPDGFPEDGESKQVDLGSSADTDLQSSLSADWFAIGFQTDTEPDAWSLIVAFAESTPTPPPTLYVEYTPAGEEYERPVSQGFSLAGVAPSGAEFGRAIEQGFSIGAVITILMEICKVLSQAFSFTGAVGITSEWNKSLTQEFSFDESVEANREFGIDVSQEFSLGGEVESKAGYIRSISQGFSIGGEIEVSREVSRSIAQDFSIAGEVESWAGYIRPISQAFSISDSVSAIKEIGYALSQEFSLSATVTAPASFVRELSEEFSFTTSVESEYEYIYDLSEDFSIDATVDIDLQKAIGITQEFSLVSTVESNRELNREISQGFSITGSVGVGTEYAFPLSQTFSFSDEATGRASFIRELDESLSFTATLESLPEYIRTLSEEFSFSAIVDIAIQKEIDITQDFALAGVVQRTNEWGIGVAQTYSISDAVIGREDYSRSLTQNYSLTSVIVVPSALTRAILQEFSFEDEIAVNIEYGKNLLQEFSLTGVGVIPEYDIYVTSPWCDGRVNPINVITPTPSFSAIYIVTDNNIPNRARFIQIQVGTSWNDNDLWDNITTVMVENGQRSPDINYDGTSLTLNASYWWRCRFGDSYGDWTEWTLPQTFGYTEAPFDLVAAAMFIFPIVLMAIALAFDNPVFASFAGIVFIFSGLFFIDIIWLAMIFIGIGIYLLLTAYFAEWED